MIYRSKDEPPESGDAPTEQQRRKAENAYTLLRSWKQIPGSGSNGVNFHELSGWVAEARKQCAGTGHLDVCDAKIGELLAHAPGEGDKSWPCMAVRDLI